MDQATGELVKAMKVSVIIPTYNGAHKIMNALRSLEKQTVKPDEVLVVIDGSTDDTAVLLHKEKFSLRKFKIIEQENQGRAEVRNRGAKESIGDLLIFLDDDIIVPANWINEHIKHHVQYPSTIVTGRLEAPDFINKSDFFRFKMWLHRKWTKDISSELQSSILNAPYISANNFSLYRIVFNQLSGFDKRLRDAEDYDLATRAMKLNIRLYISYAAFAYNNDTDNITCETYLKRLRSYTSSQKILADLKPEIYSQDHQYAVPSLTGFKYIVFSFLTKRWWIKSVDNGYWSWLPEFARFKLYDMIITANGAFFPEKVPL